MKKSQVCNLQTKIKEVMHEYKEGKLCAHHQKKPVTNRKQAIAIALSESKKACRHQ